MSQSSWVWGGEGDRELALMLLCARWPQRAEDRGLICELCGREMDWERFLLLVEHHRLGPLVARNLQAGVGEQRSAGMEVALERLRELATSNAVRAFSSLAELRRLMMEFEAQKIPVRVLKGLPLAQTAFGELGLRAVGDIDLLIGAPVRRDEEILAADGVLRGMGYSGLYALERLTPRQLAFYCAHWRDNAYRNAETGFEVDLHWGLFRNRAMPGEELCDEVARDSVRFGGFCVEALPQREALLYQCVHGTFDGWVFFKSLADVAAQVRTMPEAELDSLADLAKRYGVLPELTASLLLVRQYLAMDYWSTRLLLPNERRVKHILRYVERGLVGGGFLGGREGIWIGTTLAFEHGLRRGLRYRYELLLRVIYRARMWATFPLPDSLFVLYPLLSPVEWIWFRVRRRRNKRPESEVRNE